MSVFTPPHEAGHARSRRKGLALPQAAATSTGVHELLDRVGNRIAPLWPLDDYVAVNPFAGLAAHSFLAARRQLRSFSDCETLMPLAYYADQLRRGALSIADLEQALVDCPSLPADGPVGMTAEDIFAQLMAIPTGTGLGDLSVPAANRARRLHTVSESLDRATGSEWTEIILEEIAKVAAAHYDEGQAFWKSPWQHLSLYEAWQRAMRHDRQVELLGLTGFRQRVAKLPADPVESIPMLLRDIGVPTHLREPFLLCQLFTMPGWSAWVRYQDDAARRKGEDSAELTGLLAIRLAYEAALARVFAPQIDWEASTWAVAEQDAADSEESGAASVRYALLRASELRYRRELLDALSAGNGVTTAADAASIPDAEPVRKAAQMVFCIDVRSERMRRHLEAGGEIQTCGFAGFFGLPLEYVRLGSTRGTGQVPILLTPQFQLAESLRGTDGQGNAQALRRRLTWRQMRQAWKTLQSSAVSCFSFVESSGLMYGVRLLSRSCGFARPTNDGRYDGVARSDRPRLGPTLQGLHQQGITTSRQADLAESVLKGIGLTEHFARLVVFCGHGSQTENNPLQAGLDCGACGGHAGEPNARFAALLLNQPSIRQTLAERGIHIPEDVHFMAALHNTTTDHLEFFDLDQVPASHQAELHRLWLHTRAASEQTRMERLPSLSSQRVSSLLQRSRDWSEVRPEWGLAGNAAFIAAPRSLTGSVNLGGRTFLHDYQCDADPEGTLLEQIMTAPLVVAHLINMQYYASTVDNLHLGSGTKTIHNVVGGFGVHAGNGGDLLTGLAWQSLYTGTQLAHQPLRLLAVIAAPRAMIESILQKHEQLATLLANEWLHLVAVEGDAFYSLTPEQSWEELQSIPTLQPCV